MIKVLSSVILVCVFAVCSQLQAASAVAVAINSKGGLGYGFYHDPNISEGEVSRRAIKECLNWNGRSPRIIASTSRRGFGVVVMFLRTDNKLDYTAALAAPTWESAVNGAKRKAKDAGGRAFKIMRGWNDGLGHKQPIIMQKL